MSANDPGQTPLATDSSHADWSVNREIPSIVLAIAAHPDDGRRYYEHWLAALEEMIERCQVGSATDLLRLQQAWEDAAERTPHGQPIEL